MSEWITDRAPKREDALCGRIMVWGKTWQEPFLETVDDWDGSPWMPIARPEPYVAPKDKYYVTHWPSWKTGEKEDRWVVWCNVGGVHADHLPTREAAERVAAIYNEVLP